MFRFATVSGQSIHWFLKRNCSVTPSQLGWLYASLCVVSLGIGTVFWLREEMRRDDRLYAALNEQYGLSRRAFQLALLVRQGLTNREIARELRLSEATVKVYLHQLYRACGVASRTALIALMERAGEHG